ncbi:MAG: hypothetical protein ACREYE_24725 [Gammaproteobacteria bacterium]
MKKSAALGISRSGGARDPQVFHYTLRLLVSSLRLAPAGLARRFAPGEALLRSGGTRPPVARDDFFTSSDRALALIIEHASQRQNRADRLPETNAWLLRQTTTPGDRETDARYRCRHDKSRGRPRPRLLFGRWIIPGIGFHKR